MKKLFSLAFLGFSLNSLAQSPQIQIEKSFGGDNRDKGKSIFSMRSGGFICAGESKSWNGDLTGNHGGSDFWVVRLDTSLNIIWQKALGGTGDDYANSIIESKDGGIVVFGLTDSDNGDVSGLHYDFLPYYDYWVVKLDSIGSIEWQKCLGGDYDEWGYQINETSDSGFVMIGEGSSINGDVSAHNGAVGSEDYWIVKIDKLGNIEWEKSYGGSNKDFGYSIIQTSDGDYIACGATISQDSNVTFNHGEYDAWVIRMNPSGNIIWEKSFGGSLNDVASKIIQVGSDFIFVGNTESNDGDVSGVHGALDYWVVKLDSNGAMLWQKCYGGSGYDVGSDIKATSDNGFILSGDADSYDGDVTLTHGYGDFWIVKIDSVGNLLWEKSLGGSDYDGAMESIITSDSNYLSIGWSQSNNGDVTGNHGGQCGPLLCEDFWITELHFLNDIISEPDNEVSHVEATQLNGSIELNFISNQKSNGNIVLQDLSGRTITQQNICATKGKNIYNLQSSNLCSGLYFLILNVGLNSQVKKIMITN